MDQLQLSKLPEVAMLLFCALKHDLPNKLRDPTEVPDEKLERVLLALESVGIFKQESSKWQNTEFSEIFYCQKQKSRTMFHCSSVQFSLFAQVQSWLTCNQATPQLAFGESFYEVLSDNPEDLKDFQETMELFLSEALPGIKRNLQIEGINSLLDVGGGHGFLIIDLAKEHSTLTGAVYDLPEVCRLAQENIETNHLSGRVKVITGDLTQSVPKGFEAIVMKSVLHNCQETTCIRILQNCREALQPGSKLFVIEFLLKKENSWQVRERTVNILMMLYFNSKERSVSEYQALFEQASFKLHRAIPLESFNILEAIAI
mgnify:CR=1 FL=1